MKKSKIAKKLSLKALTKLIFKALNKHIDRYRYLLNIPSSKARRNKSSKRKLQ